MEVGRFSSCRGPAQWIKDETRNLIGRWASQMAKKHCFFFCVWRYMVGVHAHTHTHTQIVYVSVFSHMNSPSRAFCLFEHFMPHWLVETFVVWNPSRIQGSWIDCPDINAYISVCLYCMCVLMHIRTNTHEHTHTEICGANAYLHKYTYCNICFWNLEDRPPSPTSGMGRYGYCP